MSGHLHTLYRLKFVLFCLCQSGVLRVFTTACQRVHVMVTFFSATISEAFSFLASRFNAKSQSKGWRENEEIK